MKKKIVMIIAGILLLFGCLLCYLRVTEFRPEKKEKVDLQGKGKKSITFDDSIEVLTYNMGYGALSEEVDFFMDGGKTVRPDSKKIIEKNVQGIKEQLKKEQADVVFLQEIDQRSKRSYRINEVEEIGSALGGSLGFATNFSCKYIPYPFPPIGKVESGIATISQYDMTEATRIAFPSSFKWPVSMCQLKRCLLVERTPIAGSDKEVVFVNLHLEAYDSGEGKKIQSKILADVVKQEYAKGNYVIAGGDFNQYFACIDKEKYPLRNTEHFTPGEFPEEYFGKGWKFVMDDTIPTSRLLNEPYDKDSEETQYYVIDGFLVSPNVEVAQLETLDKQFKYSDHNPVKIQVKLKRTEEN